MKARMTGHSANHVAADVMSGLDEQAPATGPAGHPSRNTKAAATRIHDLRVHYRKTRHGNAGRHLKNTPSPLAGHGVLGANQINGSRQERQDARGGKEEMATLWGVLLCQRPVSKVWR